MNNPYHHNRAALPWTMVVTLVLCALFCALPLYSKDKNTEKEKKPPKRPPVWTQLLPYPAKAAWRVSFKGPKRRKGYTLETAAPAITPTLVISGTLGGEIVAVNRGTGQLQWKVNAGGPIEAGVLVENGTVYSGNNKGIVLALEDATGKEKWRYQAPFEVVGRPLAYGNDLYIITAQDELIRLDKRSGERQDKVALSQWNDEITLRGQANLVAHQNLLLIALSDGSLVAYDMAARAPRWRQTFRAGQSRFSDSDSTPMMVAGNMVVMGTYRQGLVALNVENGSVLWRQEGGSLSEFAADAGTLYVATTDNAVVALDAASGTVRWRREVTDEDVVLSNPVVVNDTIWVGEYTRGIYVLSRQTGEFIGKIPIEGGISASIVTAEKDVYMVSNHHELIAFP